jgi:hypothetical protein
MPDMQPSDVPRDSSRVPASERVRVTAPRSQRPRRASVPAEIDAQSVVGEVYMRSLIRAQLRLALSTVAWLAGTVGALPLLFVLISPLARWRVAGVPVSWVLIGGCCYPVLIALAIRYLRRAEANERAFTDLVGPE